jgi:hypothetical protein
MFGLGLLRLRNLSLQHLLRDPPFRRIATRLGMQIGTVRSNVFRLRQRWREILFEQISLTLADPTSDEIKAELFELLGCV